MIYTDSIEQQILCVGVALTCAIAGSVFDLRERRIPNRLTAPAIAGGLVLHTAIASWRGLAESALAGVIAGVIFLIFYVAGGMGAGDVKLMAAVGCIESLRQLSTVLIATAVAGGIFAVAISAYHRRTRETLCNVGELLTHHCRYGLQPHPALNLSNQQVLRLPFALPVAAGCLYTFCSLAWSARS
jgi:prepilin peptidase CpaA